MAINGYKGSVMARPRHPPTRSMNLLASRTERVTGVNYNETKRLPNRESKDGIISMSPPIRVRMLSGLQYREVVLRSVASACRFVTRRPDNPGWSEFRSEV